MTTFRVITVRGGYNWQL